MSLVKMVTPAPVAEGVRPQLEGFLDLETARRVRAFHASFPEYEPTPLVDLKDIASELGLSGLYLKDESYRFGLNAFKVLGGSYAIGRYLARRFGIAEDELTLEALLRPEYREELSNITFVTATDGNHGRGVAWTAYRLGAKSVVYMPRGSAPERLENIRAAGAEASITEFNYDDAVRFAAEQAEKNGWVMVQDTAWEGYEDIPRWIIQGYSCMSLEAFEQLPQKPTHIFVQAGVGSLATSVTGFFSAAYGKDAPKDVPSICVVEPELADCIFRTAAADDGELHPVTGDMPTIMAGLACGEPCTVGWPYLRAYARDYLSVPDEIAALGMRILAAPAGDDQRVVSGESGAATFGAVAAIMREPALAGIRERLGLDSRSVVLCFSTEGATDRAGWQDIVWRGKYPMEKVEGAC